MTEPGLMDCHEGTPPSAEQVQELWGLVEGADPEIQPYLKECACCFAIGAYSAAIVMAWCAIARYLYLVLEAVGFEVAQLFYRDEGDRTSQAFSEAIKRGDRPLYIAYQRMRFAEITAGQLEALYIKRCQYAHPTGQKAGAQEAYDYVTGARWLLTRRIEQERFQDLTAVLRCARNSGFDLTVGAAHNLVSRLRAGEHESLPLHESLAIIMLNNLLSEQKDLSEQRHIAMDRALVLWNAVKPFMALRKDSQERLVQQLADSISPVPVEGGEIPLPRPIDQFIDVRQVAESLVFWEAAKSHHVIWEYFVARRVDLTERIKQVMRQFAPQPYRDQLDEPFE